MHSGIRFYLSHFSLYRYNYCIGDSFAHFSSFPFSFPLRETYLRTCPDAFASLQITNVHLFTRGIVYYSYFSLLYCLLLPVYLFPPGSFSTPSGVTVWSPSSIGINEVFSSQNAILQKKINFNFIFIFFSFSSHLFICLFIYSSLLIYKNS